MQNEKALEAAVRAAREAEIIPIPNAPGHGVKLCDYLEYTAGDAVELGVTILGRDADGNPKFDGYSDIRADEHEDTETAILRPIIHAAIASYEAETGLNLEQQFLPIAGYDKNQPGYQYREGWNAAIRYIMDLQRVAASPPEQEPRT